MELFLMPFEIIQFPVRFQKECPVEVKLLIQTLCNEPAINPDVVAEVQDRLCLLFASIEAVHHSPHAAESKSNIQTKNS